MSEQAPLLDCSLQKMQIANCRGAILNVGVAIIRRHTRGENG